MRRSRAGLLWSLSILLAGLSAAGPQKDRIKLENAGKSEKGVLVDGLLDGQAANDLVYTSIDAGDFFKSLFPDVVVDNLTESEVSNEVIAFTSGHPPRLLEDVAWTDASNSVRLELVDSYPIRVVTWIVFGPYGPQSLLAIDASLATTMVWNTERQGVVFDSFDVRDATANPEASHFNDFTCALAGAIRKEIGFDPDAINVYYVEQVDFGAGFSGNSGVWCGSGVIGMGSTTSPVLLAHEIGHGFGLQHIDGLPQWFDTTNVMHPSSNSRRYLTEGQTFRSVFNPSSALNNIYDVRTGETVRACPSSSSTTDPDCPAIQKRIWADGSTWPPN